jgi:hypothetical protein
MDGHYIPAPFIALSIFSIAAIDGINRRSERIGPSTTSYFYGHIDRQNIFTWCRYSQKLWPLWHTLSIERSLAQYSMA